MQTEQGRRPGMISRVVTWLRAGYPEGIPTGDYVALLGVLRRRLHEEEIQEIVERLAEQRSLGLTSERIRELIREYSLQDPYEADVERVTALLTATGYPVDADELAEETAEEETTEGEAPEDETADDEVADGEVAHDSAQATEPGGDPPR